MTFKTLAILGIRGILPPTAVWKPLPSTSRCFSAIAAGR